jgi:FlaG protein
MPADPVQSSPPTTAAEQVFSPAQPKGKPVTPEAPAPPAKSQPDADYAELSQAQQSPVQAPKQSPPAQDVLAYHVDEQTKQLYFQVLDPQSGKVILQVPPQSVLNEAAQITQYLQAQSARSNAPAVKGKGD